MFTCWTVLWVPGTDIRNHSRLEKFKPDLGGEQSKSGPGIKSGSLGSNS